jgi:hypothetical protein
MKNGVILPWEQRSRWLREGLRNMRWSIAVSIALVAVVLGWLIRVGDRNIRTRITYASIDRTRYAIERFAMTHGRCPASLTELVQRSHGESALLPKMPTDGWGRALHLSCTWQNQMPVIQLRSRGARPASELDWLE